MVSIFDRARRGVECAGLLGRDLLVALSGGVDSVCLLRLLLALTRRYGGTIEAAHLDHGLRPGSGEDAEFCEALARDLGVRFHRKRLNPEEFAARRATQAEARILRRRFLEETLRRRGLSAIALGHNADDQVETVLYRLIRGTGPRGAGGMDVWASPYVRPLLGVRRHEIEALASEEGWPYREDPTNRQGRYARNRLRLEALPLLRSIHPGCDEAILRFARLAAEDDRYVSQVAREAFGALGVVEPEGVRLPVQALSGLSPPVRRRVYLAAWETVGCDPGALEAAHLEAVDRLLEAGRPHRVAPIPGPGAFGVSYDELWVLRPGVLDPQPVDVRLERPGRVCIEALGAEVVWSAGPGPEVPRVSVPTGRGAGGLRVRTWRPGDRVDPGTGRAKKVKDLLMAARVPLWRRHRALVVADAGGPLGLLARDRAWGPGGRGRGWVWVERQ